MHPGFGQSGSSSAKGRFSNDWEKLSNHLDNKEKANGRYVKGALAVTKWVKQNVDLVGLD
jgi:hypothetical protein